VSSTTRSTSVSVSGTQRTRQIVRDALRTVASDDSNDIQTLESLTIHRNGFLGNDEQDGIKQAIGWLRGNGYLPDKFQWAGVEVTHRSPHRLYDDRGMPEMGSYAQLSEKTAVVVTTDTEDLYNGSPQTLQVTVAVGNSDLDAFQAGRDLFFLSELNWGSPSNGTKEPITVLLTQKMNQRFGNDQVSKLRYPPF
jgi:hypothetical protein